MDISGLGDAKLRVAISRLAASRPQAEIAANIPASLEAFVCYPTLRGWESSWWLRIPLIREGKIADVLFHEIGHHIHFTCRPEYREKEDVADVGGDGGVGVADARAGVDVAHRRGEIELGLGFWHSNSQFIRAAAGWAAGCDLGTSS